MNETQNYIPEMSALDVDKSSTDHKTGMTRLNPFQRPVLPPAFYPILRGILRGRERVNQ